MTKLLKIGIIGLLLSTNIMFSSCSSDEPTQPGEEWVIGYTETFKQIHNDDDEVRLWFENHAQDFNVAYFYSDYLGVNKVYDNESSTVFDWSEYSNWPYGKVGWVEYVYDATEEDILLKVEQFTSFTIGSKKDKKYDIYEVQYKRVE